MPSLTDQAVVLEAIALQMRTAQEDLEALRKQDAVKAAEIAAKAAEIERLKQELEDAQAPTPPPVPPPEPTGETVFEGFGSEATGGSTPYRVTNLNNSGAGSLRDGCSQSGRKITFDVGGVITLSSPMAVQSNTYIDALSAPSPGITLRGYKLDIVGRTNVIVRGFRVHDVKEGEDAIRIFRSKKVMCAHMSVNGFGDGGIDVTGDDCEDVTVQWCIIANGVASHNFANLIGLGARRVSAHHNLYIKTDRRNPQVSGTETPPAGITADVRMNLIWGAPVGTLVRAGMRANVVNNYYHGQSRGSDSLYIDTGGLAYAHGNVSKQGHAIKGNVSTPFAADREPVLTGAIEAAHAILAKAGARGTRFSLDDRDQALVRLVTIT